MGRRDGACEPEAILNETNTEPSFVRYVYGTLLEKLDYNTQIMVTGNVIKALHPDAEISEYAATFMDNKDLLDKMDNQNQKIYNHILTTFTKDTDRFKKEDYQDVLHGVHLENAAVRMNFNSRIYNNLWDVK